MNKYITPIKDFYQRIRYGQEEIEETPIGIGAITEIRSISGLEKDTEDELRRQDTEKYFKHNTL